MTAGVIKSYRAGGQELFCQVRVPISGGPQRTMTMATAWRKETLRGGRPGRRPVLKSAHVSQPGMGSAGVEFTFDIPGEGGKKIAGLVTEYTVHAGGSVECDHSIS
jgi:hypothetical protein